MTANQIDVHSIVVSIFAIVILSIIGGLFKVRLPSLSLDTIDCPGQGSAALQQLVLFSLLTSVYFDRICASRRVPLPCCSVLQYNLFCIEKEIPIFAKPDEEKRPADIYVVL